MTIINILYHQPAYDCFKNKELPGKGWRNNKGEIIGISGNEFAHSLGNAILKLTKNFNYEVWQPDLRADEILSHTFENGLTYRLFPAVSKRKLYGVKLVKYVHSAPLIRELVKRAVNENIIINLNTSFTGINKSILEKAKQIPVIFTIHAEIRLPSLRFFTPKRNIFSKVNDLFDYFWIKHHIGKIKYITHCNDKNLNYLKRIYKGKMEKITMGCDFSFFKKLDKARCRNEAGLPRDKFIMTSVATLRDVKEIDKFIEVLIKIEEKYDFLYVIVGHGTEQYEKYLIDLSQPLIKKNKIKFVGYQRGEWLLKYLNSADLFISSSRSEGASVSIMEAFACELPVFSTKTGQTAELMEEEQVGCLAGIKNYPEWKEKLENILKNKQLPKILNRDLAKEHYDWENIARRFIKIYKSLLN